MPSTKELKMIPEEHAISMESVVRQHGGITRPMLIDLYNAAKDILSDQEGKTKLRNVIPSLLKANNSQHGDVMIATATDERSGTFVQLAAAGGRILMTIGQKWAVQQPNAQGTLVTAQW